MMNKMYKAPENANRVKTIKSKFENIEKNKKGDRNNSLISTENGTRNNLNEIIQNNNLAGPASPKILERQLSDPAKRNIKRTPAFRLDKNSEKTNVFQRGTNFNKSNNFTNILKPVNSEPKMNCASDVNNLKENNIDVHKVVIKSSNVKPLLLKSKSSHDFNLILSRFAAANLDVTNPKNSNESRRQNLNTHSVKNVTALYTEPIPKALRSKLNDEHVYLNTKNLDDKPSNETSTIVNIHNSSTLRISDLKVNFNKKSEGKSVIDPIKHNLTDTLKYALKRPLPGGPAPKKPPRTFKHFSKDDNIENLEKNKSFLHLTQNLEKQKNTKTKHQTKKADAKYMLDKLETALRNNKLKSLKHAKQDVSTTSGEDSDDSLLFKSKGSDKANNSEALREGRLLPAVPDINDHRSNNSSTKLFAQALNFNCLNALSCNSPYERVKESNSSFFISSKNEEPVYAEPFHFQTDINDQEKMRLIDKSENKRNSLYYMSSPVLGSDLNDSSTDIERSAVKQKDVPYVEKPIPDLLKSLTPEISSLSSFTSDSALSTPMEDKSFDVNIKQLINSYENKSSTSKNATRTRLPLDSNELDNRVDDLRWTLQKTIDKSFKSSDTNKDSSSDTEKRAEVKSLSDDTIDKFRTYVKKVAIYAKCIRRTNNHLFYCCLIVEWNADVRRIKYQFPYNVTIPNKIEDLCFPDAASGPMDITVNAQSYSLVITDEKGERTYGYCRRVIPEGSTKCLPIVYCILSKHRAPRFYNKILTELESRHGISDHHRNNLMSAIYNNKFPEPGQTIIINLNNVTLDSNKKTFSGAICDKPTEDDLDLSSFVILNVNGQYETVKKPQTQKSKLSEIVSNYENSISGENLNITFNFHHDAVYENSDLKPLHQLSNDILIKVFSSVLLERKVILISCLLCKLSSCIEALHTILYPFSWPYTYIPVLPRSLWEFVESPTPIICGILSVDVINKHEIEHAIVVDLDEGCILKEEGDEDNILCSYMLKAWHKSIAIAKTIPVDHEAHSYHLSDAYLHMFVVVLRNYKSFIIQGQFQREAFIREQKSKGVRRFLKWFTETTMFLTFIDGVISNSQDYSLFDTKISMYGSENSGVILNKLLEWKR